MKRQTLVNGLLSLTAVTMMTGCVDDKYDLSDIDTTSRFTVDNLTVPVNLSEIKLKNVVNLDDNENISTIDGVYAISKDGSISPTEFKLDPINVNAPHIDQIKISVPSPGVAVSGIDLPAIDLPHVDKKEYDISMNGIEDALKALDEIKTTPINIQVTLSVPSELSSGGNKVAFQNLKLQLPWGLLINNPKYNNHTGILDVGEIEIGPSGSAFIVIAANGLNLLGKGAVKNGYLGIKGEVGIEDGCKIKLTINESVTIPSPIEIKADFQVSSFSIEKFSGSIDYKMDDIKINPISLSDLPDFLNNPETNIIIANPQIKVNIVNPVAKYGLVGKGRLTLSSQFKEGNPVIRSSDVFNLADHDGDGICGLTFAPKVNEGDPDMCAFTGLGYVLTMLDENPAAISGGWGLPESISVAIEDLSFAGNVTDFPLGNIGSASGDYSFNAPLGFESGSTVFY
ncbi:MAG: hypothetical protein K2N09_07750, partial [Muribaculaceae bacterium]|nr:hypothetical protein [Muribaculaceae bacterium]